jgi:hypothetical protein
MSVLVVRAGRHVVEPLVPRGTAIAVIVIDDELVDNEEEAKGVAGSPRRAVAAAMVLGLRPVRFMLRSSRTSLSRVQRQSYISKQESAFGWAQLTELPGMVLRLQVLFDVSVLLVASEDGA